MMLERLFQGRNSVLYDSGLRSILYEKLSNTIHTGKRGELESLQRKIEEVDYNPKFESETLKGKKGEGIENIVFNVTESCNFNCSYCIFSGNYKNERSEKNYNMGFNTAKKAIDLLIDKTKDPFLMSFYGGEPLNNMRLILEIIRYTKQKEQQKTYAFSMTSNFYNADKYIREIIGNEIHINVSLDGPQEIHDKNRKLKGGKQTYEKIMENLGKFERVAPEYVKDHLRYNVTCALQKDLPKIVEFFQKNKQFGSARISMIEQKGLRTKKDNNGESSALILAQKYVDLILSGKEPGILRGLFDQPLKRIAFRSREIMPEELMLNGSCYPGTRKLFVDTDGTFYMCERFGRRLPIGNIGEGIKQDYVNDTIEKFKFIRNMTCNDCWAQRLCTPCIQSSKDPQREISEEGLTQTCDSNKSQILLALAQYTYLSKEKEIQESYIKSINP